MGGGNHGEAVSAPVLRGPGSSGDGPQVPEPVLNESSSKSVPESAGRPAEGEHVPVRLSKKAPLVPGGVQRTPPGCWFAIHI